MASLSNINDKFAVESTGAIKFNGQVGTSGYILKSNGNTAPTWVDPDDVIGGPYLPLTGGTLTGNLALTDATNNPSLVISTGSLTVGGATTLSSTLTISGRATFPSAVANRPQLPGGFLGLNTGDGNFDISRSPAGSTTLSEFMRIDSSGNVGIGTTTPYSRLDVNGVITNRTASADPKFTVTANGMSVQDSGSLQFTQGFAGTSSAGDTVVFTYSATSWKSWNLEFVFTSTGNGSGQAVCKGNIGGYNNNNGGGNSNFTQNLNTPITAVATNSGQHVIVTFTGDFGIHMMCDMRYSQGGGDGSPRADRASLTYNS